MMVKCESWQLAVGRLPAFGVEGGVLSVSSQSTDCIRKVSGAGAWDQAQPGACN